MNQSDASGRSNPRRSGDKAVPGQETQAAGPLAGRVLADDGAACGDVGEQAVVLAGVGDIGTAGENGDRAAAGDEGAMVSGRVDAVGGTRNDSPASAGKIGRDLRRHMKAIGTSGARSYDGDGLLAAGSQVSGAAHPQRVGPDGAEIIKPGRPASLTGA